jgi:hypothetical protein
MFSGVTCKGKSRVTQPPTQNPSWGCSPEKVGCVSYIIEKQQFLDFILAPGPADQRSQKLFSLSGLQARGLMSSTSQTMFHIAW